MAMIDAIMEYKPRICWCWTPTRQGRRLWPRHGRQGWCGVELVPFETTGVGKAVRGGEGGVMRYVMHAFLNVDELFAMAAVDGGVHA